VIQLHDAENDRLLGTISEAELQFLIDELEEESKEDRDYYISADTVDMLEDDGASATLVSLLRGAIAGREGADIRWTRV